MSVAISWEIFFGDRVREGVAEGAGVVLNPTNGSSFTGTLVQTQQVASSRMRLSRATASSTRWASPPASAPSSTPDGTVQQRSAVRADRPAPDHRRARGHDALHPVGLRPAVALAVASLALGWLVARTRRVPAAGQDAAVRSRSRRRPRSRRDAEVDDDGDRPVVHEGDAMSARNRPVATRAPSARSSATTASTSGSACSGGAARPVAAAPSPCPRRG